MHQGLETQMRLESSILILVSNNRCLPQLVGDGFYGPWGVR